MGFNIGKMVSVASKVATGADLISKIGGIDLSNVNPSGLGSIKSKIESTLNGSMDSIMSNIQSSVSIGDIESMAGQFDIEGKAKELQSTLQSGTADMSKIEEATDMSKIQSQVDSMMNGMNFSNINIM